MVHTKWTDSYNGIGVKTTETEILIPYSSIISYQYFNLDIHKQPKTWNAKHLWIAACMSNNKLELHFFFKMMLFLLSYQNNITDILLNAVALFYIINGPHDEITSLSNENQNKKIKKKEFSWRINSSSKI